MRLISFTFHVREPVGDVPGGLTVSRHGKLPEGDFGITEFQWGSFVLWFVDDDNFTDDERQECYEAEQRLRKRKENMTTVKLDEVPEADNEYWLAVTKCLVKFAGQAEADAKKASDDFRNHMESGLSVEEMDFFYHEETYDIAKKIAEERHGWPWTTPLSNDDYVKILEDSGM